MYINCEIKNKKYLTVEDVDCGECFTFIGDETVFMKTDDSSYIVRMRDGTLFALYDDPNSYSEKGYVELLRTELRILDN